MLSVLLGSKNAEKILLFLLVNEKCYGMQLQRLLGGALTPIQKTLQRLECAGIIMCEQEGKTRLYRLNPVYPLHMELEALLKRAYLLLGAQEKKRFHFARHLEAESQKEALAYQLKDRLTLDKLWSKMAQITQLTFLVKSRNAEGRVQMTRGRGEVEVTRDSSHVLIYEERGSWKRDDGVESEFKNVYRWTLDREKQLIGLEHLRQGRDRPVFLFYLAPADEKMLESVDPHLCGEDCYFGKLADRSSHLQLLWRLLGPKKNEQIEHLYH